VGPASRLTIAVRCPLSSRESPVYGTGGRATAEKYGPVKCRALTRSGSFPGAALNAKCQAHNPPCIMDYSLIIFVRVTVSERTEFWPKDITK
jgi:hypothetical protein